MHPEVPQEGQPLADLFEKKNIPIDLDKAMASLKETAQGLGLEWGDRTMTFNSRLAQEVGLWAQENGRGHEFHVAVFQSYFVRGENIAQKDTLLELVEQVGLDRSEAESVIRDRSFSNRVVADWELCRQKGVMAAPTFLLGLDKLVGAHPYAKLEQMVMKNGAVQKTS